MSRGKITVGGMDVSKVDPETLLSLYSIVFQDVTLFDNTILENIRIGNKDATDEEVLAAARLANVDEFAEKLPDKWNSYSFNINYRENKLKVEVNKDGVNITNLEGNDIEINVYDKKYIVKNKEYIDNKDVALN